MAAGAISVGVDELLPESIERMCRNPLLCYVCQQVYDEPCLLVCFHSLCAKCVRVRVLDGSVACPICSKVTVMKAGQSVPPTDMLLRHLVQLSSQCRSACANCEMASVSTSMFFCKTCGQALCERCKDETHRARMFSAHDIVPLCERMRKSAKQCPSHQEPYIMFDGERKQLLCICCFREYTADAKLHCVDLDSAYADSVRRLDRTVLSIRELQNSVRDGIILYRALLDEVHHNMEAEKIAVASFFRQLHETVTQQQQRLMTDLNSQYSVKNSRFQRQLCDLCSLLPVLHVHLNMCTTFTRAADKTEFLDLCYSLMSRLSEIAHISVTLRPGLTSQVKTNYRRELARVLDPLLSPASCLGSSVTPDPPPTASSQQQGGAASMGAPPRRSSSACRLHLLTSSGPFSDTCRRIEARLQETTAHYHHLRQLSPQCAERACQIVENEVVSLEFVVDEARARLQHRWHEVAGRLQMERDVFSSQVFDLQQLRSDLGRFCLAINQQHNEHAMIADGHTSANGFKCRPDVPRRVDSLLSGGGEAGLSLPDCSSLTHNTNKQQHQQRATTAASNCSTEGGRGGLLASVQAHGEELLRSLRQRTRSRPLPRWRVRSEERRPPPAGSACVRHHSAGATLSRLTWSGRGDGPPVTASCREATVSGPVLSDGAASGHSSASWPRRRRASSRSPLPSVLPPPPPPRAMISPDAGSASSSESDGARWSSHCGSGKTGVSEKRTLTRRQRSRVRASASSGGGGDDDAGGGGSSATDDEHRLAFSDTDQPAGGARRGRHTRHTTGTATSSVRRLKSADSCDLRRPMMARGFIDVCGGGGGGAVRRADSFEGHEQTVQTIVAAVHQCRSHVTDQQPTSRRNTVHK